MGRLLHLLSNPTDEFDDMIRTTFANLPAAASAPVGKPYYVTDIGGGSVFISTGSIWKPMNGTCLLAASAATGMSVTGSTSKTVLASVSIPAGLMTANGSLRVLTQWAAGANNANVKIIGIDFGQTGTVNYLNGGLANFLNAQALHIISNQGAANAQVGFLSNVTAFAANTGAITTSSVNTANATAIDFTGQLGNGSDTLTLVKYAVELMIP